MEGQAYRLFRSDSAWESVFCPESLGLFSTYLAGFQRVVLVCHANPDGDAIGSMVALALALRHQGHEVLALSPNPVPRPLSWLASMGSVRVYDELPGLYKPQLESATRLICLDFNQFDRAEWRLGPELASMTCPRIMIDHHVEPDAGFDLYFSYPFASSTAELVYEILSRLYGEASISAEIATALYTGIMTDTGSFSYACSDGYPHYIGGCLIRLGADVESIRARVYGSYSESRLRLWGYALSQQMRLLAGGRGAMIPISHHAFNHYDYRPGDLEGLVNEPLSIEGVDLSVLVTMRVEGLLRVSLRSRNGVEVHHLARDHFDGGGHPQAAGGKLRMAYGDGVRHVERIVEEFLRQPASSARL